MTLAPAARTPHDPRAPHTPYADGKDCVEISRGLVLMTAAAPAARQMPRGEWRPSVCTRVILRAWAPRGVTYHKVRVSPYLCRLSDQQFPRQLLPGFRKHVYKHPASESVFISPGTKIKPNGAHNDWFRCRMIPPRNRNKYQNHWKKSQGGINRCTWWVPQACGCSARGGWVLGGRAGSEQYRDARRERSQSFGTSGPRAAD